MTRSDGSTGELAYFTFGLSAVRDDRGEIIACFNPATETTARMAAEAALAATQRRLDAALLAGEVGTFQWDIPDDRLWGDANFARIFGIQLDESGAAPLSAYLAAIHQDDRERTNALVQRTVETGAPYEAEYRIVTGSDRTAIRWVEARGRVEYDVDGRPLRFPGVVQDITRRREAEAERERLLAVAQAARREAELANRVKSDFLASMSHELRTPLNAIGGYTQLLDLEIHGPLTEAQRGTLARIERAQRHLLGLINDVLNYAKIERGKIDYTLGVVRIREVIADVLPMIEPTAVAKELVVNVADIAADSPDAPLLVWADREKLAQVLLNLLSNATKFTGPRGRVDIGVEIAPNDQSRVLVQVRDTGIGIPPDKLEAIFEPFVQVRRGDISGVKAEGTGLGLAISRDLARGMGGDLTASSVEGEGSLFTLSLQRAIDG
jgi:PAS domain S-box-containing protein